ncbi:O-antigen ligase family protein [Microbacterium aerolatum]|uniref:O-antigen ligase family protein n=1 Tax=Microbacterium aerolatum TaxID=153731 RepID=UPI001649C532|nr:O-antigen ligase family protein [Microbacterium aerolatum]
MPWASMLYLALALLSVAWSAWPSVTLLTWVLLASATMHGLFLVDQLDGQGVVLISGWALQLAMALSLFLELWVATIRGHPLLPNFAHVPTNPDPHWYWVRGNLLDGVVTGGRIQGIVGNSNLLAALCLLAMIICVAQFLDRQANRLYLVLMFTLSCWLFVRANSATMIVTVVVIVVAVVVIGMFRVAKSRRVRTSLAVGLGTLFMVLGVAAVVLRGPIAGFLGKDATFTGRARIWELVIGRAIEAPVLGNGFASPWLPWDPAFSRWIVDHDITVFQAHNMWLDVFMQLGFVGVACIALIVGIAIRNGWLLAQADRTAVSSSFLPPKRSNLIPFLAMLVLLVQGLTESSPVMLWGWTLLTMISALGSRLSATGYRNRYRRHVRQVLIQDESSD